MQSNRSAKPVDYLVLVLIPLLSSFTPIAVEHAVAHIPAILAGGMRFSIAGVGLWILLAATGRLKENRPERLAADRPAGHPVRAGESIRVL